MVVIWNVAIGAPETIIKEHGSDTDRMDIEPEEVFGYVNEMLTTIIGLINIVAFGYQMRDRRKAKLKS